MSASNLDPYHRWLGIPPKEQPPDHYRLLGIERFEDDLEVIRDGAERQMRHVRSYGLGEHAELSQQILNKLGKAKGCLLHSGRKESYDSDLRQRQEEKKADEEPTAPAPPPIPDVPSLPVEAPPDAMARPPARPPQQIETLPRDEAKHDASAALVKREIAIGIGSRDNARLNRWRLYALAPIGVACLAALAIFAGWLAQLGEGRDLRMGAVPDQQITVGDVFRVAVSLENDAEKPAGARFGPGERFPEEASIDSESGWFEWSPGESVTPGSHLVDICLYVNGREEPVDEVSFVVNVSKKELPVQVAAKLLPVDDQTVFVGKTIEVEIRLQDPGEKPPGMLFVGGRRFPEGARIDPETGRFQWTPSEDVSPGDQLVDVDLYVGSGEDSVSDMTFVVHVAAPNATEEPLPKKEPPSISTSPFASFPVEIDLPAPNAEFAGMRLVDLPPRWIGKLTETDVAALRVAVDDLGASDAGGPSFEVRPPKSPTNERRWDIYLISNGASKEESVDEDGASEKPMGNQGADEAAGKETAQNMAGDLPVARLAVVKGALQFAWFEGSDDPRAEQLRNGDLQLSIGDFWSTIRLRAVETAGRIKLVQEKYDHRIPLRGRALPDIDRIYLHVTFEGFPGNWSAEPKSQRVKFGKNLTISNGTVDGDVRIDVRVKLQETTDVPAIVIESFYFRGREKDKLSKENLDKRRLSTEKSLYSMNGKLGQKLRDRPGIERAMEGFSPSTPGAAIQLNQLKKQLRSCNNSINSLESKIAKAKAYIAGYQRADVLLNQIHQTATITLIVGFETPKGDRKLLVVQ